MGISFTLKKLSDREIRIVINDQDKHSLPNLLAKLALKKPGVTFAGYIIEHPVVTYPELVIMTDGSRSPLEVLKEVLKEVKTMAQEFVEELDKALTK
uniref:DNA-directed RNA polymerase subunit Rpo11 n=1 Tax=Ignisphaera aggregans TaxID=334771 RepID=A0A7C2VBD8_9CREN